MKSVSLLAVFFLLIQPAVFGAGKEKPVWTAQSPDKSCTVRLLPAGKKWVHRLSITRGRRELCNFLFKNELLSIFWSPSGDYVANNNHYGHRAWRIWVISLKDGALITAHGPVKDPDYDFYLDSRYLPEVWPVVADKMEKIYGSYKTDRMRESYLSIAYGWNSAGNLQLYHEFVYDELSEKKESEIVAYTELEVRDGKLRLGKRASVRMVKGYQETGVPPAAKKALNSFVMYDR